MCHLHPLHLHLHLPLPLPLLNPLRNPINEVSLDITIISTRAFSLQTDIHISHERKVTIIFLMQKKNNFIHRVSEFNVSLSLDCNSMHFNFENTDKNSLKNRKAMAITKTSFIYACKTITKFPYRKHNLKTHHPITLINVISKDCLSPLSSIVKLNLFF